MTKPLVVNKANAKQVHDLLMASQPEGAPHDRETCGYCLMPNEGGSVAGRTYTEDELNDAVNPLLAKMSELQEQIRTLTVEGQVETVRAESEVEMNSLQAKLDAKELERQAATEELAAFKAAAEKKDADDKEAKEKEDRKDEREKDAKEKAGFSDDYIKDNLDRWAGLSDEAWTERLADWAAIAPEKALDAGWPAQKNSGIPNSQSPLSAAREPGVTKPNSNMDAHKALYHEVVGEVLQKRFDSFDPRTI
jgi:hypothetical protein